MFKKIICASFLAIAVSTTANANDPVFMVPVGDNFLATANDVVAIKNNGDSVCGDIKSISMMGAVIKNLSIKDTAKIKYKFVPEDLKMFKWKLSKMARMVTIVDNASNSISSAINTDYGYLCNLGYAVWDKVQDPEKESNAFLLQVLNPTYCNVLKVYATPAIITSNLKKNEVADEYIISKGGKSYLIEKKKYEKKQFAEIFGDSPEMITNYPQKKIDWDDLPKHVMEYTNLMNK